jgi:hypothetical protein
MAVICPLCQRQYAFKSELAGKRVRCKCGQVMTMPQPPPAAEEVYDIVKEPEPVSTPVSDVVVVHHSPGNPTAPPQSASMIHGLSYPSITRRDRQNAEEQRGVIKLAAVAVGLLILLAGAVLGMRFLAGPKPAAGPVAPPAHDDAEVAAMMDDYGGTEARKWLSARPGRMLSGLSSSQAEFKINQWYEMGVEKVWAFGGVTSMAVALELPSDAAKRQAIFEWARRNHVLSGNRLAADVGQKYLLVRLGM